MILDLSMTKAVFEREYRRAVEWTGGYLHEGLAHEAVTGAFVQLLNMVWHAEPTTRGPFGELYRILDRQIRRHLATSDRYFPLDSWRHHPMPRDFEAQAFVDLFATGVYVKHVLNLPWTSHLAICDWLRWGPHREVSLGVRHQSPTYTATLGDVRVAVAAVLARHAKIQHEASLTAREVWHRECYETRVWLNVRRNIREDVYSGKVQQDHDQGDSGSPVGDDLLAGGGVVRKPDLRPGSRAARERASHQRDDQ